MSNETSRDGEPGRDVNPETVLSVCLGGWGGGVVWTGKRKTTMILPTNGRLAGVGRGPGGCYSTFQKEDLV